VTTVFSENLIGETLPFFRLKSQKEFLIKFDSEPERIQWMNDLVKTWKEAQKLLKVKTAPIK
jgi:hypothetical protein